MYPDFYNLFIHIYSFYSRYLYQTEIFTKQDPYTVLWTTSTADEQPLQQTATCFNGGKNAVWNETFTINVNDPEKEYLFIEVMDKNNLLSDQLIGRAKFGCSDLDTEIKEAWIRIYCADGSDGGEVLIAARIQ